MIKTNKKVILASGSSTRKMLLEQSGINFKIEKSSIDEEKLKNEFLKEHGSVDPLKLGIKLAIAKAKEVSTKFSDHYVIGGDQVCFMDGEIFDKPGNLENCEKHLKKLRDKEHSQNCACSIVYNNEVIWQYSEQALLKIKNLSDEEIKIYVTTEKPSFACGSYMLENNGKHIFEYIHGDHDVVLGMPLIPLLNKLHSLKVIEFSL